MGGCFLVSQRADTKQNKYCMNVNAADSDGN